MKATGGEHWGSQASVSDREYPGPGGGILLDRRRGDSCKRIRTRQDGPGSRYIWGFLEISIGVFSFLNKIGNEVIFGAGRGGRKERCFTGCFLYARNYTKHFTHESSFSILNNIMSQIPL